MKKTPKWKPKRTGSVSKPTVAKTTKSPRPPSTKDECLCDFDKSVPWWLPICVTMVTMVARVTYVISPASYWVLHPDEVYQSVEVAFSQVYGYGFRAYEYLPPPDSNSTAPFMQHTLQSGMYALRSFMFPHVFTLVLHVFKFLRLDSNPYMICRIFNVIVTSTLPFAVYTFTHKLFRCRLVAVLSCALAASGVQITVFGTRPFINSFIAPFVFLSLSLCIDDDSKYKHREESVREDNSSHVRQSSPDCNGNVQTETGECHSDGHTHLVGHSAHVNIYSGMNSAQNNSNSNEKELIRDQRHYRRVYIKWVRPITGGFILGMVSYVRVDTVLFYGTVLLPIWSLKTKLRPKHISFFVKLCIGISMAILLCAMDDYVHYGLGTFSPVQWFKFNVLSGKANFIFGSLDPQSYAALFLEDKYKTAYFIILSVAVLCCILQSTLPQQAHDVESTLKQRQNTVLTLFQRCINVVYQLGPVTKVFLSLASSMAVLIIIYSSIGHKEKRFLFNVFVLYEILLAVAFHYLISFFRYIGVNKLCSLAVLCLPISTQLLTLFNQFPMPGNGHISKWNYGNALKSRDLNLCLEYLGHIGDVNGILINGSIYDIGGYCVLKHNVPMIVKVHYEFNLYESRANNTFSYNDDIKVLNDFQDLFHQSNIFYISKLFRNDERFNYIVSQSIPKDLTTNLNFTFIKHCGKVNVYRRETANQNKQITVIGQYPAGNNATVLEYEANWLLTHGMYTKAIERIQRALELDRSRVRLFQQIMVCYERLGLTGEAKHYQNECYRQHGREKCRTQQDKVILHNEYKRFDVQH